MFAPRLCIVYIIIHNVYNGLAHIITVFLCLSRRSLLISMNALAMICLTKTLSRRHWVQPIYDLGPIMATVRHHSPRAVDKRQSDPINFTETCIIFREHLYYILLVQLGGQFLIGFSRRRLFVFYFRTQRKSCVINIDQFFFSSKLFSSKVTIHAKQIKKKQIIILNSIWKQTDV